MGTQRNGARTVLNLLQKCCKLSRLPGFRAGVTSILGTTDAATFFPVWDALCAVVDVLVGADNFFNQVDFQDETPDNSEDITLL